LIKYSAELRRCGAKLSKCRHEFHLTGVCPELRKSSQPVGPRFEPPLAGISPTVAVVVTLEPLPLAAASYELRLPSPARDALPRMQMDVWESRPDRGRPSAERRRSPPRRLASRRSAACTGGFVGPVGRGFVQSLTDEPIWELQAIGSFFWGRAGPCAGSWR
jgi:hypothetical protein